MCKIEERLKDREGRPLHYAVRKILCSEFPGEKTAGKFGFSFLLNRSKLKNEKVVGGTLCFAFCSPYVCLFHFFIK